MRESVEKENRMVLDWAFMEDVEFLLRYVMHGTVDELKEFARCYPGFMGNERRDAIREELRQEEQKKE